ncbi:hypothetical protein SAMN02745190_01774 [Schwartzia succinivorans DSM 10502]|uniref:Uncharacterized protein n=1 Tax=Schwartzia succinivorans DSM 10502 TaxID=1123243 RepID=A0A1M4YJZ7_9FIRM|nr:hypothetical protein SAMN02745190_01774 [Schwartzia succinivorans DSM 10502]
MPGACQLSGNVVPAVGKSEGATPRRIRLFSNKIFWEYLVKLKNISSGFYIICTNIFGCPNLHPYNLCSYQL